MRVLVIGVAGQLGRALAVQTKARGDSVVGTYNSRVPDDQADSIEPLDKTDAQRVEAVLQKHVPDVVIDTAALHNVDYCELHPEDAYRVNREGTRFVAQAAAAIGAKFVFVSTDFVFSGTQAEPYRESDTPAPASQYALSKLEGEGAALAASDSNLVVRPSVIYSWVESRRRAASSSGKGLNFGSWLAEEVGRGHEVRIVDDQTASPTLAEDLAGAIVALVAKDARGVFHTAGGTATTRYGFSVRLVERLQLDSNLVRPVRTVDLNQKAPRPSNSSLDSGRLTAITGYRMMSLPSALDRFAEQFEADPGAPHGSH